MKKYLTLVAALSLGALICGPVAPLRAQEGTAGAVIATEVSKEDAAKKYPLPAGKTSYPEGLSVGAGPQAVRFFRSPYSSRVFDCRKINKKGLVLDSSVNKVFVRP